jgi:hypothetical protein
VASTKAALYYDKQVLNEFLKVDPNSRTDISPDIQQPRKYPKQASYNYLGPKRGNKGKLKGRKAPTERRFTTPDREAKTLRSSSLGPEICLD